MILKFHMVHNQTTGLQNEKIQCGWESKMVTSAKNSKTNEINFFSSVAGFIWLKFFIDHK